MKDRQTILDKSGSNGLFLASHDATVKAMVYKTTESVSEIRNNAVKILWTSSKQKVTMAQYGDCVILMLIPSE